MTEKKTMSMPARGAVGGETTYHRYGADYMRALAAKGGRANVEKNGRQGVLKALAMARGELPRGPIKTQTKARRGNDGSSPLKGEKE